MCLKVFVAADEPLPLIEYSPASPVFQVETLYEQSLPVLRYFTKPYVYSIRSVGECAYGFSYDLRDREILDQPDAPEDIKANVLKCYDAPRASVLATKEYLRRQAQTGSTLKRSNQRRDICYIRRHPWQTEAI
ncbi:hypothetical protein CCAX7_59870 [Capsulimonas corticalis]|uniref:Uncharacterized protein n=1 Tax=Capsulimonas corticalis TaxID=2219043 RepID=A0A402CZN5_9BACT|nr:hypothetical protein CCAX7_59870 [Capsulimonas corticalis]